MATLTLFASAAPEAASGRGVDVDILPANGEPQPPSQKTFAASQIDGSMTSFSLEELSRCRDTTFTKSNAISLFLGVIREEQVMRQSVHSRVEKTSDDQDH